MTEKEEEYSRIINQNINIPPLLRQVTYETPNLLRLAHVQLYGKHLHALTDLLTDLLCDLLQGIDAAGRQDQLEPVVGRGPCKLEGGAAADAGRGACDDDGLIGEALGCCC